MQKVELRRRVQIWLNKGEAKNALARAVFLNRLREIRDRSFENQRYRASGLNLLVAAIILWDTVCPERAVQVLRDSGKNIDERLLPHLSPRALKHINLTVAATACRSTKAIAQRSQHGVWNSSIFMTCAVCRHRPVPRRPGSGGHFQAPFMLMTLGTLQVQ